MNTWFYTSESNQEIVTFGGTALFSPVEMAKSFTFSENRRCKYCGRQARQEHAETCLGCGAPL